MPHYFGKMGLKHEKFGCLSLQSLEKNIGGGIQLTLKPQINLLKIVSIINAQSRNVNEVNGSKRKLMQSKVQRKSNYFLGHLEWASLLSNVRMMTLCFSSRAKLLSIEKEESCHPSSDSWYALSSPTSTSQPQQSLLN